MTFAGRGFDFMKTDPISENIRLAREFRQMTQAALAKATGLQPAAISHFETGERRPSIRNLRKICNALEFSADWLLGIDTKGLTRLLP